MYPYYSCIPFSLSEFLRFGLLSSYVDYRLKQKITENIAKISRGVLPPPFRLEAKFILREPITMEPFLSIREVIHVSRALKMLVEHNVRFVEEPVDEPMMDVNVFDVPVEIEITNPMGFNLTFGPDSDDDSSSSDEDSTEVENADDDHTSSDEDAPVVEARDPAGRNLDYPPQGFPHADDDCSCSDEDSPEEEAGDPAGPNQDYASRMLFSNSDDDCSCSDEDSPEEEAGDQAGPSPGYVPQMLIPNEDLPDVDGGDPYHPYNVPQMAFPNAAYNHTSRYDEAGYPLGYHLGYATQMWLHNAFHGPMRPEYLPGVSLEKPIQSQRENAPEIHQRSNDNVTIVVKQEPISDDEVEDSSRSAEDEPERPNVAAYPPPPSRLCNCHLKTNQMLPYYDNSLPSNFKIRNRRTSWHHVIRPMAKSIQKRRSQQMIRQRLEVPEIREEIRQQIQNDNNYIKEEVIDGVKVEANQFDGIKLEDNQSSVLNEEQDDSMEVLEEQFRNISTFGIPSYDSPLSREQLYRKLKALNDEKVEKNILIHETITRMNNTFEVVAHWKVEFELANLLREQHLREYELKKLTNQLNRTDDSNSWYGFHCP